MYGAQRAAGGWPRRGGAAVDFAAWRVWSRARADADARWVPAEAALVAACAAVFGIRAPFPLVALPGWIGVAGLARDAPAAFAAGSRARGRGRGGRRVDRGVRARRRAARGDLPGARADGGVARPPAPPGHAHARDRDGGVGPLSAGVGRLLERGEGAPAAAAAADALLRALRAQLLAALALHEGAALFVPGKLGAHSAWTRAAYYCGGGFAFACATVAAAVLAPYVALGEPFFWGVG